MMDVQVGELIKGVAMSKGSGGSIKLVGALVSGLSILRYLSEQGTSMGVTKIARELQINPSTCFNLLRTLVHEGLVHFDESTKAYSIDLGLIELAKGALDVASYARMVRPHLEAIASHHAVTATLWQKSGNRRVVLVDLAENAAAVRVHMSIGQRLPMFIAALGRCMAAYSELNKAELKREFDMLRWADPPSFDEYWQEVQQVMVSGYACDEGRYVKGVTTVSVPVLGQGKQAVMAISAVGFTAQLTQEKIAVLANDLSAHAQIISRGLTV